MPAGGNDLMTLFQRGMEGLNPQDILASGGGQLLNQMLSLGRGGLNSLLGQGELGPFTGHSANGALPLRANPSLNGINQMEIFGKGRGLDTNQRLGLGRGRSHPHLGPSAANSVQSFNQLSNTGIMQSVESDMQNGSVQGLLPQGNEINIGKMENLMRQGGLGFGAYPSLGGTNMGDFGKLPSLGSGALSDAGMSGGINFDNLEELFNLGQGAGSMDSSTDASFQTLLGLMKKKKDSDSKGGDNGYDVKYFDKTDDGSLDSGIKIYNKMKQANQSVKLTEKTEKNA